MDILLANIGIVLQPQNIHYDDGEAFLLLQLDMEEYRFPKTLVIYEGEVYQPKDELHITVLSQGAAKKVQEYLDANPGTRGKVEELIRRTEWSYEKIPRFYHVRKNSNENSLIQLVRVPGLPAFYAELSDLVGKQLEQPPTHVTIYTRGNPEGIGLPNHEVFEALVTRRIELDELERLDRGQED